MNQVMKRAFCGLVVAFGLSVSAATMTPFDDCVWWFEGGVLTSGETSRTVTNDSTDLFDLTHASTPDGATHQTAKIGADANLVITNMEVVCPMIDMVVTQAVLRVSNDKQADDKYYPPTCTLPEAVRGNFTKTSAVTIVGRVRVSSSVEGNSNRIAYLFDFGYKKDGTEYYGFPCGFQSNGAGSVGQYYWTRLNDSQSEGVRNSTLFKLDQWVDVAWVFKDGSVAYAFCTTNSTEVNWFEKTDSIAHFGQGGDSLYLFRGNSGYTQGGTDASSNLFKGDIARLAIWNRELTKDEIEEAFVYGGRDHHIFGLCNDSDAEFGGTTALRSASEDQSWKTVLQTAAPSLEAGETFTYSFVEQKNLDRTATTVLRPSAREIVVSFALTSASSAGRIELRANGEPCKTYEVRPGERYIAFVPASRLSASSTQKTDNAISFVRTDSGASPIRFDYLSFTKGWQVGYADMLYSEWVQDTAGDELYMFDRQGEWTKESGGVKRAQDKGRTMSFRFFVPDDVASCCPSVFTFGKNTEGSAMPSPWSITDITLLINGQVVKTIAYQAEQAYLAQTYTVVLPPGTLKGGLNAVGVGSVNDTSGGNNRGWIMNDYFRFEFKKPPEGFVLTFR